MPSVKDAVDAAGKPLELVKANMPGSVESKDPLRPGVLLPVLLVVPADMSRVDDLEVINFVYMSLRNLHAAQESGKAKPIIVPKHEIIRG